MALATGIVLAVPSVSISLLFGPGWDSVDLNQIGA